MMFLLGVSEVSWRDCSLPGFSVHGFSRQEYWSGLPCPPPGNLPKPGIEPTSLMSPALTGGFFTTSATWEAQWSDNRGEKNLFLMEKIIQIEVW